MSIVDPMIAPALDRARASLAQALREMVGSGELDLARPPGDPGLIADTSPAWRVHGDFSAMMIGGISALLLQMLHPGALAGVWDHSDFRRDRLGRLRRTAQFIAVTTYGPTDLAERTIAHVRAIHDRIHGHLPDGAPYDANDPALLTWVHVAEADSFLRGYLRYRDATLSPEDQDRYVADVAIVAERLGACDVPRSRADIAAYYRSVRPQLRGDHRVRKVADALLAPGPDRAQAAGLAVAAAAALDLLPDWAAALHDRRAPPLARPAIRAGADGMSRVLRWALRAP
ncbi:MAG: oxygenase MpaB family protein [Sphingomonas phyllosphaerae]|uniref:oxygenase MpaB family protein n=1 Tax=Sphingomonas phyllosphaerae TaxID=257003 RepID=UPI002FFC9F87